MLWQWHEPVEQNVLGEEDEEEEEKEEEDIEDCQLWKTREESQYEILNHLSGKQEPLNIFTDTLQNKPGRTQVIEHAVHMVT